MTAIANNFINTATQAKDWVVENKKALLVATLVAAVATTVLGLAIMATASRIFSVTDIIACTMESCSIITHYTIDPTFLKGLVTMISGLFVAHASRQALAQA